MHPFEESNLIAIPGGTFRMGQADGRDEEQPVHWVSVEPFRLASYQVTNAEYDAFLRATGREMAPFRRDPLFACPNQPVVGVSWFDAVAYCEWLAQVVDLPCRLPTEAEWEFAARAGLDQSVYPWGNDPMFERENYHRRWREAPEPVGTSLPNAFGLFDMCENVHEWCSDWFDPSYYAVSPEHDPRGPGSGMRRASRGGAWRHHLKISRCAARSSIPPEFKYADYGFRVAAG
jgi:formylglycine-generating enzyme required for sulfatase activity